MLSYNYCLWEQTACALKIATDPIGSRRKTLQKNIGRNCEHAPAGRGVPPRRLPLGGDSHEMGGSLPRGSTRARKRPISQMGGSQPVSPTPHPGPNIPLCVADDQAQLYDTQAQLYDLFLLNMSTNILLLQFGFSIIIALGRESK